MPDITREEKQARDILIDKSYSYLVDNFHKFTETNKIKVALEIIKKAMPTQLEHSGAVTFNQMSTVIVHEQPMELNFGEEYRASRDTSDTRQANTDNN